MNDSGNACLFEAIEEINHCFSFQWKPIFKTVQRVYCLVNFIVANEIN